MRIINYFPLLISIVVITILAYGVNVTDNNNPNSYVYTLSKQELTLTSGETLNLGKFKGEYYLVHLFASWCSICHEDIPLLEQIKSKTKIPLIGIAVNDKLEKVVNKTILPYDFVAIEEDHHIAKLMRSNLLPETIIINKEGIVEFRYIGALYKEEVENNIIPIILQKKS